MSIVDAKQLTPAQAISAAKKYFDDFFGQEKVQNILLEELEFDESDLVWKVTIGFDIGRTIMRQSSMNALASMMPNEVVPVRESRQFFIRDDANCSLVKMVDG